MDDFELIGFIAPPRDDQLADVSFLEAFSFGSSTWLFAGSAAGRAINRIDLEDRFAVEHVDYSMEDRGRFSLSDATGVRVNETQALLSFDPFAAQVTVHEIAANGQLGAPQLMRMNTGTPVETVSMTHFAMNDRDWLVGVNTDRDSISLYQMAENGWRVARTDTVTDTAKTHVSHVSDTVTVDVEGSHYVVTASADENGMTSYRVGANGSLSFVDSIGTRDGLWASGLSDMTSVEIGGDTFVLGVGTQSGTLAAVRINPSGVFFVTDVETDDRDSRFAGVKSVESFSAQNRDFVLVGGTDGGLSLFELLPGGTFFHHNNAVQTQAWNLGTITEITAHVSGDSVQVTVAGAADGGLAQLGLSVADLGVRWEGNAGAQRHTGTDGHDMIMGGGGNDTLNGGAGDDVIHAGTGVDRLTGGAGADTFVFVADEGADRISDFERGQDQIDVSGWGMLYHISALNIQSHSNGATIRFHEEELRIFSADGRRLDAQDFEQDSLLF